MTPIRPLPTLAALQAAHAALAGQAKAEGATLDHATAVQDFVARAVATGTVLDARDDRQAAQSLVNYWVSRSASEALKAGRPVPAVCDPGFDTLLPEFDPATLRDAIAAADERLRQSEADPALVRRLLLRLVRMRPADPGFDPAPTSRANLRDLPNADPGTVDRLVDDLAAAGVLRVSPGPMPEAEQVGLRPAVLATDWAPLREAQESRRQFRARTAEYARQATPVTAWGRGRSTAVDWLATTGRWVREATEWVHQRFGGRPELELLSAEEQDDAEEYHDLNEPEVKFLRASRSLQRRLMEANLALVWLALAVLAFALVGWVKSDWNARAARDNAAVAVAETRAAAEAARREGEARVAADAATQKAREALAVADQQQYQAMKEQQLNEAIKQELKDVLAVVNDEKQRINLAAAPAQSDRYQARFNELLAQQTEQGELRDPTRPLRPGTRVWLKDAAGRESACSVCCFVRSPDGRRFALVFGITLGLGKTAEDVSGQLSRQQGGGRPVGNLLSPRDLLPSGRDPDDRIKGPLRYLFLAELDRTVVADNQLPIVGRPLRGIAPAIAVGEGIRLLGSGSGLNQGKVLRTTPDGEVMYTRISAVGDAGGPVFNDRDELVAMHLGGREGESFGVLLHAPLAALNLTLIP